MTAVTDMYCIGSCIMRLPCLRINRYDPPGNAPSTNEAFLQNVLPLGSSPLSIPSVSEPISDSSGGSTTTKIVMGTCIAAGVVIAALAGFLVWHHSRQQHRNGLASPGVGSGKAHLFRQENNMTTGYTSSTERSDNSQYPTFTVQPSSKGASHMMAIPGLMTGEPFTRGTAFEYSWNSLYSHMAGVTTCVEAGVNDINLDAMAQSSHGQVKECPVVCLSKDEVKQQLQLLTNGLRGRGGAALVFKALWPSRFGPDALVAVKVLKDGYDCNPYVLGSFMHEASVLASVRHPNVVKLYGFCLDPPNVCLIMELLPCSLKEVLYGSRNVNTNTSEYNVSSHAMRPSTSFSLAAGLSTQLMSVASVAEGIPLTMSQVLQVSTEIAAGLVYLHDQPQQPLGAAAGKSLHTLEEGEEVTVDMDQAAGTSQKIVHRDLKPANILINSLGQVKISDFGLARRHDSTTIETRHVGAGTVPYQAPEILSGSRAGALGMKATNRCDVYSMAMIFWELLSKRPPWKDLNEVNIITQVIGGKRPELPAQDKVHTDTPPDLTQLLASLTALPAYNDIIRQCWAQRDWRTPTAAEAHRLLLQLQQKYQATEAASVHIEIAGKANKA